MARAHAMVPLSDSTCWTVKDNATWQSRQKTIQVEINSSKEWMQCLCHSTNEHVASKEAEVEQGQLSAVQRGCCPTHMREGFRMDQ